MNLLIVYALIFLLVFIILGIKLGLKNKSYLISAGITFTIITIGIVAGIIPTKVGKCGDNAFYISDIYKTTKVYGKGTMGRVPEDTKNVIISDGIYEIGYSAFWKYENLEKIEISESVEKIDDYAFYKCAKLANVEMPKSLKFIGKGAFVGCESIENIQIPESVEQMCLSVFSGTKISEVNIPDNAIINLEKNVNEKYYSSYGGYTFYGCRNLKKINISENNRNYINIDDVIFDKDKTKIECYPEAKEDESYVIPDTVQTLHPYTFTFCNNLKKITISKNIKNIEYNAIYNCENLEIIEIENGVREIDEYAIKDCDNLSKIYIPDSVTQITGRICNSDKITIYCNLNSYAQKYAESYGYQCVLEDNQ